MDAWLIWAIVAVLLAVGEIFTPGMFFLGPVALAAVVAGVTAAVGLGVFVQLIVFIAGSIASVLVLRPIARRHLHMPAQLRTGTAALEGGQERIQAVHALQIKGPLSVTGMSGSPSRAKIFMCTPQKIGRAHV